MSIPKELLIRQLVQKAALLQPGERIDAAASLFVDYTVNVEFLPSELPLEIAEIFCGLRGPFRSESGVRWKTSVVRVLERLSEILIIEQFSLDGDTVRLVWRERDLRGPKAGKRRLPPNR